MCAAPLWQHHKQALDDTWDMDFAQPQSDRPDRTDPQLPRRSSDLLKVIQFICAAIELDLCLGSLTRERVTM